MKIVNMHEAKTHLSRIVDRVAAGEHVTIAKAGKPLAQLVPLTSAKATRKLGLLKGKIKIGKDFDAPLPDDVVDLFEN